MVGLWVPTATGAFTPAKGLWAADAGGTLRPVKNGWASKADGSYGKLWPMGLSIPSFSATQGSPAYQKVHLAWSTALATKVQLRLVGSSSILYEGTGTSYDFTGAPGTQYSFSLRAIGANGSYVDSMPATVTLATLPAPTSFRRVSGNQTSTAWAWNGVTAASGYDLLDTLASNAVRSSPSGTSMTESGLTASTTYERAVRSKLSGKVSGVSNKVRYTTPANTGSAPGTYTYNAVYQAVWATGRNSWRPSGEGCIHGNGDVWGGGNGANYTYLWYAGMGWRGLSGRVTRFKARMARDSTAGYSAPQANLWGLHGYVAQPSGPPWDTHNVFIASGTLGWGAEGAFDLPIGWGQNLIDTTDWCGIVWGRADGNYMRGPSVAAKNTQGALSFTIG